MKRNLYRLHSIAEFFDFNVIENKDIHLKPQNLIKDIFESNVQIIWNGTLTQWKNLFTHYIYCFTETYLYSNNMKNLVSIGKENIPIHNYNFQKKPFLIDTKIIIAKVTERTFEDLDLDAFSMKISGYRLSFDELLYILNIIRLSVNLNIYESQLNRQVAEKKHNPVAAMQKDKLFKYRTRKEEKKLDQSVEPNDRPAYLSYLQKEFPKDYLALLQETIFPYYYTLKLTKSEPKATRWNDSGDMHKGICLIYDNSNFINSIPSHAAIICEPTSYSDNNSESFNFFEFAIKDANYWLDPNQSREGTHWIQQYKRLFSYSLLKQNPSLSSEDEIQCILYYKDSLKSLSNTLPIEKNNLKGLIFGSDCDIFDKNKIIDLFKEAADAGKINQDFEFYQAALDKETNEITTSFVASVRDF